MVVSTIRGLLSILGLLMVLWGLYLAHHADKISEAHFIAQANAHETFSVYAPGYLSAIRRATRFHWTGVTLLWAQAILHWIFE